MILPFSQKINGWETKFPRKIWEGLWQHSLVDGLCPLVQSLQNKNYRYGISLSPDIESTQKLHTIRVDAHDRWKAGRLIHFVINNRSPNYFNFAPVIKATAVEKIQFEWRETPQVCRELKIFIQDKLVTNLIKFPNGDLKIKKGRKFLELIAVNDGFDNEKQFLDYFNENFTGKIIHWTDVRYEEK